jgi:hypothetical protein
MCGIVCTLYFFKTEPIFLWLPSVHNFLLPSGLQIPDPEFDPGAGRKGEGAKIYSQRTPGPGVSHPRRRWRPPPMQLATAPAAVGGRPRSWRRWPLPNQCRCRVREASDAAHCVHPPPPPPPQRHGCQRRLRRGRPPAAAGAATGICGLKFLFLNRCR